MSEIRDILNKALPDSPAPISIDRESMIVIGRRARRRRNWAVTASAAAGVLVVGAGVAGGLSWAGAVRPDSSVNIGAAPSSSPNLTPSIDPTPTQPVPSGPSLPPTPTGPTPSSPTGDNRPTSGRNVNEALTQVLRNAVAEVAPTVGLEIVKDAYANQDVNPFEIVGSQGGMKTFAELHDSEGKGYFFAFLETLDPAQARANVLAGCDRPVPGVTCATQTFPTGETVMISQGKPNGLAKTMYTVKVAKPDGTLIDAMVENYSHNDQPRAGNPNPQRLTPPLSVEQMTTILLKPGVTLST